MTDPLTTFKDEAGQTFTWTAYVYRGRRMDNGRVEQRFTRVTREYPGDWQEHETTTFKSPGFKPVLGWVHLIARTETKAQGGFSWFPRGDHAPIVYEAWPDQENLTTWRTLDRTVERARNHLARAKKTAPEAWQDTLAPLRKAWQSATRAQRTAIEIMVLDYLRTGKG